MDKKKGKEAGRARKPVKPSQEEIVKEANARAVKIYEAWKGGKSYRILAESMNLSFGRVRQIVRRGKKIAGEE